VRVELVQQHVRRARAAGAPPAGQAPGSGAVRAARHMRRQAARPGFLRAAQAAAVICRGWWQEAVLLESVPWRHGVRRSELNVGAIPQLLGRSACCACASLSEHRAPGRAPGAAAVSALRAWRGARDAALPLCVRPRALRLGACGAAAAGPLARRGGPACAARSAAPRERPSNHRGGRARHAALPAVVRELWAALDAHRMSGPVLGTVPHGPRLHTMPAHSCHAVLMPLQGLTYAPQWPWCAQLHSQAELATVPVPLSCTHNK